MNEHYGEIVEKIIRRNGYSISDLARIMNVNRRSIYSWFKQPRLKTEIIFKIGCALKRDLSTEFPDLFSSNDFQNPFNDKEDGYTVLSADEQVKVNYWKDKYIDLLEQYNASLSLVLEKNGVSLALFNR